MADTSATSGSRALQELPPALVAGRATKLTPIGLGLLLFIATVAAYGPALHGGLIMDDSYHVTAPELRSWAGLWRIWSVVGATHQYFPVLHSAFWIEHRLWGDSLLGYHLINVLLHAGSACLLVVIMRRLSLPGAWLGGFIFALHPICVESVAWISEQKNTLSTFFALASVLVYLRFDETRRWRSFAIALGLYVLAVLSKGVTITLPGVLLVIVWWKRARLQWIRDVLPLAPWGLIGVLLILPAVGMERKMMAAWPREFSLSWDGRSVLAGRIFWFYLWKVLWPVHLVFMYPRWNIDARDWRPYGFTLAALALLAGLAWYARRNRGPMAAVLIFAGTLLPVLGFADVNWFLISYVGDHLEYLSSLAIIVLFASGVATIGVSGERILLNAATGGLVVVLGILTWRQSRIYRDAQTLYRATLAENPSSWVAHYNLGDTLNQLPDRQADVIAEWEATVRYKPDYVEAQNNLGCILASDPDRVDEAIAHFQAAMRFKPEFADAHANLAAVLSGMPGRTDEAIDQFEQALRYDPGSAETHNNFGNMLMDIPGRLDEAIAQLEQAVRINPNYAEAHWNLAVALSRIPSWQTEAIEQVRTAMRLDPNIEGAPELLQHLTEPEPTR
jgi:protein O-mannosyl-transferase